VENAVLRGAGYDRIRITVDYGWIRLSRCKPLIRLSCDILRLNAAAIRCITVMPKEFLFRKKNSIENLDFYHVCSVLHTDHFLLIYGLNTA
jgi:hypothetical protein